MTTLIDRIRRAIEIVMEQRSDPLFGRILVVSADEVDNGGEYVNADEMRDVVFELQRLQRAILGEPDP
jgi:hypothetical protein